MDKERRILLIGGVGLVKGRVRDAGVVMVQICDELEPILRDLCFTRNAPFRTVSLILRFGTQRGINPECQPIDKSHDELPMTLELEMQSLKEMNRDELKNEFMVATLEALIIAGQKYGLPTDVLERSLRELSSIKSIDERLRPNCPSQKPRPGEK